MKVLFDSSVILSIWKKDKFFLNSFAAYDVCMLRKWEACISVNAIPHLEQQLAAHGGLSQQELRDTMERLFDMFSVLDVAECDCRLAYASNMHSTRDAMVAFSAKRNNVDVIITRSKRNFAESPVSTLTPTEFVAAHKPSGVEYNEADFA